jgi:hypothetical protein
MLDVAMAEPRLESPRIVPGVRQGEAARVPQHVRMDWKRHASALAEAHHQCVDTLRRHRATALGSKHMRTRRVFALQAAQGADLVTLNRMNAWRSALAAADVQAAGGKLDLVPLKIAQLAGSQVVSKALGHAMREGFTLRSDGLAKKLILIFMSQHMGRSACDHRIEQNEPSGSDVVPDVAYFN